MVIIFAVTGACSYICLQKHEIGLMCLFGRKQLVAEALSDDHATVPVSKIYFRDLILPVQSHMSILFNACLITFALVIKQSFLSCQSF